MSILEHTLDWLTLKRKFIALHGGEAWPTQPVAEHIARGGGAWQGGTADDTADWLTRGYDLPGFSGGTVTFKPRQRRRPVWNSEDGGFDLTRALCGDENYRLTKAKRDVRRGATVEIGYGFLAGASARVIGEYGKFAGALIRKLEAEGLDVAVDIVSDYYLDGRIHKLKLRVKRVNERADFKGWSAIFAPTGHRHLIFLARAMCEDRDGRKYTGPGKSMHRGWKVERDGDTIKLDCDSNGRRSPLAILEAQAKAQGLL